MILVARGELLMPLFFPTPYPDELLYSIIARYKKWSGEVNHRSILHDLFGNGFVSASMDLPSHIGQLVKRLPITSNITVEQLIQKHTMYPLYSAFLPSDQASAVFQSMAYGNGSGIYMRTGVMASSIRSNTYIRFCKNCYIEDIRRYGEGYWHRMHQIPGVDVCIEHETNLQ
ncbi:TniQ family protein, partial [Escherichia coli]|uniref:TniQ family protein n=1 Tax=Escherichia coli TaxID=562 RepID=UPI001AED058C